METKKYDFGEIREIPKGAEESRIIPFILSTMRKDRHGTVLNQDNWDLEGFRSNPIMGYQHNLSGGLCADPNPDFVIGKGINHGIEDFGGIKRLISDGEFEPNSINPLAEKVFRKILFGSLSRTSVGFRELGQGKYGNDTEARGGMDETYYFAGQELLEFSVVNIPSNKDAGKRGESVRTMREAGYVALMYAMKELGGKFRLSQIENFRVNDILDLLDGKDIDLKEKDPDIVRKLLADVKAKDEQISRLNELLRERNSH